jgi:hypothetical protein
MASELFLKIQFPISVDKEKEKEILRLSASKRTIPTEPPPLVGEFYCQLLWIEGCRVVSEAGPHGR